MNKSYSELITIKTYEERLKYLQCKNLIGEPTFGGRRYLNQQFYRSYEWVKLREKIIARDNGCDLAIKDFPINGQILIHHINSITVDDIINRDQKVFDPENLICVSFNTHNAIHFGEIIKKETNFITREINDTCPWK